MTVNIFQIGLVVLIGFMAIPVVLLTEEVKKAESLFQKIAFCLLIAVCAGIGAIAGSIIRSPVNDTTYWVLGICYPVALLTTWILLQRQQQAERENLQRQKLQRQKLRQALLTRVTEDVNERWKFSLPDRKFIQVSSKPHDHLAPLPPPALPAEPQPSLFEILKPVADVSRSVHIFKPDAQEPEIIALELNTPIIEIFNQDDIGGKLLILGEPGSGKTTELLNLAIALCNNAANSEQVAVPVIFELSAWKGSKPIAQWLAEELKIRDGIDESLTLEWLRQDKIIPLLDGLDELKELKEDGIEAINQFYQKFRPQHLVICSRLKDYRECQNKLAPKGAICLQPLNDQQIQGYLEKRKRLQLWQPIKNDPDGLLELARSPLLLNLISVAYQNGFVGKGKRCQTDEEREAYQKECRGDLFDAYIEHQLASKVDNRGYSKAQTKQWLTWLAQRLREERRTDFYIEKMPPTWLETPAQRQKYQLAVVLIYGMIVGLIVGLIVGVIVGLIGVLILGLTGGLDKIELTGVISLSHAKIQNWMIGGLIGGLIVGVIYGVTYGDIEELIVGLIAGLILGVAYGLILGLIYGLIGLLILRPDEIELKEAISLNTAKMQNWLIYGGIYGLILGLIYGVISEVIHVLTHELISRLISRLMGVLVGGLIYGGIYGVIGGLMGGLMGGLIGGLMGGLKAVIRVRKYPSHGIRKSAKKAIIISIFSFPAGVLCLVLPNLISGIAIALILGIFGGGGLAWIQHFVLRVILYQSGAIPWNYADFLDYADELDLIDRVGGRYRFYHDLLREHFAGE